VANESIVVPAIPKTSVNLTRKQESLVAFIEHSPKFASFATAAELAKRVGVNPATVVRLAQALGYSGFPELKEAIQHRYLASLDAVALMHEHAAAHHGDTTFASIDQDIRNLAASRGALDAATVRRVANLMLKAPHIVVVGFGSHAGIAMIFGHLCRFMGLPAETEFRGGVTLATRLAQLEPNDVVIGTSAWWVVREALEALEIARERGATTVAIVDSRTSGMVQFADYLFITPTESVSFFQSMTAPLAVFNAIAAEIAVAGKDDVQRRMDETSKLYERLGVVWHDASPSLPVTANDVNPRSNGTGMDVVAARRRRRRAVSERPAG
jgi:DNA-binding MurR/RpiR family transcriptional regulator